MTPARCILPGRTYLISRRCTQRQFLLRPDKNTEQLYLYLLALAAERYDVEIVAFILMANHHHLEALDKHGNLPEFLCFLHSMMAKAMNSYLGRWENFWAAEQASAVYLVGEQDRFDKLIYLHANPVAADLVDRVSDWPGVSSLQMNLSGKSITVKRPKKFFDPKGSLPDEVTLTVARPEGFKSMSDEQWAVMVRTALEAKEATARAVRMQAGRCVLGRKAVQRIQVTDSPKSEAPRRNLRPCIACKDANRRKDELEALLDFRFKRQAALERLYRGKLLTLFPPGTYRIRGVFFVAPTITITPRPRLLLAA